jgi:uncharacterized membrane protein
MTILVIGLLIWILVHLFKRVAPGSRQALSDRLGSGPARGLISLLLLLSVVLMIFGYRSAPTIPVYDPMPKIGHLNNLLMIVAVLLMGMGSSRGRMRSWLRHPMLTGVGVWAIAHLLVNGDRASMLLFGGMLIWAVLQRLAINSQETWTRPEPGPLSSDAKLVVITLVVFTVIAGVHTMLGYSPFLGSY